jgi:hypothetical protein
MNIFRKIRCPRAALGVGIPSKNIPNSEVYWRKSLKIKEKYEQQL